jgi:hypothetical protein
MTSPSLAAVPVIARTMAGIAASNVAIAASSTEPFAKPILRASRRSKSIVRPRPLPNRPDRSHPKNLSQPMLADHLRASTAGGSTALSP